MADEQNTPHGIPLITFDLTEESESKWQKVVNFFKSTIGKIVIFTVLFLGIAFYILTTSNVILFQGRIFNSADLIAQSNNDAIPSPKFSPDLPVPNPPTDLNAGCLDNGAVTLKWTKVPWVVADGNTQLTYMIKVGDKTDTLPQAYPDQDAQSPAVYSGFTAVAGQKYQWSVSASANGKTSAEVKGQEFSCVAGSSSSSSVSTLTPEQIATLNLLGGTSSTGAMKIATDTGNTNLIKNLFSDTTATAAPTNLKYTCEPNNSWVTLDWTPGVSAVSESYKVGVFDQSVTSDIVPDPKTLSVPTYRYPNPKLGQKYAWRVNAVNASGKMSDPVTSEFICGTNQIIDLGPVNKFDPSYAKYISPIIPIFPVTPFISTPCPDNQYFVTDSNSAKSACKNIPSYQGAAVQSDFICGLYTTIAGDAAMYKINDVTKATLQKGIASQCKNAAQPQVQDPPVVQTVCPVNTFLNGGVVPTDCKSVPSLNGLAADQAAVTCNQLKTLYGLGASIKMSTQTIDNLLVNINGPVCSPKAPVPPDGQLTVTSGGNDATSGTTTTNENTKASAGTTTTTGKVSGTGLVALQNQDVGTVIPSHPVAGKQKPHGTASTGPEMWVYGVGVVMSYYGARRKKSKK